MVDSTESVRDRLTEIRESLILLGADLHDVRALGGDAEDLVEVVKCFQEETRQRLRECQELLAAAARSHDRRMQAVERRYDVFEKKEMERVGNIAAQAVGDAFDPRGCFVYVLWGEDDQVPIYVGQSTNVLSRLGQHLGGPIYRGRVRSVSLVRCRDGKAMDLTEMRLIRHYRPRDNVIGNESRTAVPPKPALVAGIPRLAYALEEAASLLDISYDDALASVLDGKLPAIQLGRKWLVRVRDLEAAKTSRAG